jgi:hypothetical protein
MRLAEIQSPPIIYYLASNKKLDEIAIREDLKILPDGRFHLTEAVLEKYRPEDCLPRATSILLARSPDNLQIFDQQAKWTYRVVLGSPVQWSDAQWLLKIREAMTFLPQDRPSCEEWARTYWSSVPCPIGTPIWEGRTKVVRVIGRV